LKRILKLGAVFAAMLFIGMAFVPGVSAYAEGCEDCGPDCDSCHTNQHAIELANTDCTSCHEDMDPLHTLTVTTIELVGSEKNIAVAEMLANEDVKLLRNALIMDGYTPAIEQATAAETTIEDEDGQTTEVLTVIMPFRDGDVAIAYSVIDEMGSAFGVVHYVEDGKDWYTIYTVSDGVVSKASYDLDVWTCLECAYCAVQCAQCTVACLKAIAAISGGTWWIAIAAIIICADCGVTWAGCIPTCQVCLDSA